MSTGTIKTCRKCGVQKPTNNFYRNSCTKDGLQPWCKSCGKDYAVANPDIRAKALRTYREKHPDEIAEAKRRHNEAHPEARAAYTRKYGANNPEARAETIRRHRAAHPNAQLEYGRKRRTEHPEECAALAAKYKEKFPERVADSYVRSRNKYPERHAARTAVGTAIRYGDLVPQPCFCCGEKSEAHHASYDHDMLLAVTWLCRKHHKQIHREALP